MEADSPATSDVRSPGAGSSRNPAAHVGPDGGVAIEDVEASVQRDLVRGERRARISAVLSPVALVAAIVLVWEGATRMFSIPPFLLPAPSAVFRSLIEHAGLLVANGWTTTFETVFGFALSIAVGIPLAFAIFLWPPVARALLPLIVSSQAMPKVAVAPLFLVWFGFGLLPKVLIAFLIAFFPVVINTSIGLAGIEADKIHLARSMGMGKVATFLKIRLPDALPAIFGGLKISITLAVVGVVVGEFVGGDAGLGYLLMVANGSIDTALLFADLVVLTVLGVLLYAVVDVAERVMIPAHARTGGTGASGSL